MGRCFLAWLDVNRGIVLDNLRQDYARIKEAEELMHHARRTLLSIKVDLMSPEHEALRQSILQEALSAIRLINMTQSESYIELSQRMSDFFSQETTMKACLQGDVVDQEAAWDTISKVLSPLALLLRRHAMEDTFDHAGLVPPGGHGRRITWESIAPSSMPSEIIEKTMEIFKQRLRLCEARLKHHYIDSSDGEDNQDDEEHGYHI